MKHPSYLGSSTDTNGSKQAWADGGAAARDLAAKDLGLSFLFPSRHTAVLDQSIRCLPVRFSPRIKGFSRWLQQKGTYVLFMSHLSCARLMSKTLSRVSERHVMLS